ncbi:uncharacterized protein LOC117781031 [Drosophila innubila]|uniref:uncharacterized protein LOC117781031 n=1 Tax=Drosophila innubila TaxID=198719 RepID=UPI00148E29A9|nr:uncharacterized protein LOC117781031 [Drosophila innubila]
MKPLLQWLFSISAGLLVGIQTMRLLKVANEENESYFAHIMDSSAIQNESDLPYIMGSEQISAALQQILSSDENILENRSVLINDVFNPIQSDYALGSESLNRTLEELLASSCHDNAEQIHFEPAIQL